ncbi:flavin reductase like domain-containing protein [Delphinella strobiligena]|nr:flavin reductase like domain-containing protein [Delphinella strobiligena]
MLFLWKISGGKISCKVDIMSLVRWSAAGHESARRFYSAFYHWSRLTCPQSHVKPARPKHIYPKRTCRTYSTRPRRTYSTPPSPTIVTTPESPNQTVTTPESPKQTVTLLLNDKDHALLTRWQNANLKIIATQTGAFFHLGDSAKFPKDGLHRLFVHGTQGALVAFSRGVMEVSTSGKAPDGGTEVGLKRRGRGEDGVDMRGVEMRKVDMRKVDMRKDDTTKVDTTAVYTPMVDTREVDTRKDETAKVDTPKVDTQKNDTTKVDTPKVVTPKVVTPVVSAGTSDEVATNNKSAGASSKAVTPATSAEAPVASSTGKNPMNHRIAYLTPLEQANIHILTESLLDAIKAETGVLDLTISTQHSPVGHPVIRLAGSKTARALAIKAVRDAVRKVAPPPPILEDFKQAMRSAPSSVAVITGSLLNVEDKKAGFRGMTVSSFTAVTVYPEPIISFNIRTPSRTFDALDSYGKFFLHIPAANILGKTIADAFTKPHADPTETFRDLAAKGIIIGDEHQYLPSIYGHGIVVRFLCNILTDKTVSIGDHVVLFAKVQHVWKADLNSSANHPRAGLAYVHGKYSHCVSETMKHSKRALKSPDYKSKLPDDESKLPDDESIPMLTPEQQIMAQIAGPILDSKPEQQVFESGKSATRKEPTSKPSRDSEAEETRLQDMNERYFTSAEEYDADVAESDLDAKYPTNASTSAKIPTDVHPFAAYLRPATTATTPGLPSTRRTISTSTTPPPTTTTAATNNTNTTTDPSILSQTVESHIYQAFDPETDLYNPKLRAFHIRIAQRQTLDKCAARLRLAHDNGDIDDEALEVLGGRVDKLRRDLVGLEMDRGEYEGFVGALEGALDEFGGVREVRSEEVVEGGVEEGVEEGLEDKDTGVESEVYNETGQERRAEIGKEENEEDSEKKDVGLELEEMMDKRRE